MRRQRLLTWSALALGLVAARAAHADPPRRVLRIATIAPEGSVWAREAHAFARATHNATGGGVSIKLTLNGTAGDEEEMAQRIARGQLDGAASGGMLCERLMPSMAVMRLFGVFQNREESQFVLRELEPVLSAEAHKAGFELLGIGGLGADILFSRKPLRTWKEVKATRLWRWNLDTTGNAVARAMGLTIVELPVMGAAKAYDDGRVDGISGLAAAGLAFQWYSQVKYVTNLPTSYLSGCTVVAQRAFDPLPQAHQKLLRAANVKFAARIEQVGAEADKQLLEVFQKRGIKLIPVTDSLRAEFFDAARTAREQLAGKLVPKELLDRVLELLADYRAEHRQ